MSENALLLDASAQHIKDIKLAIEFKHLMKNSPGGIYLLPEFDNIRNLHGVIFVRRGLYRSGVFRFVIALPSGYNDTNTHPQIVFTPPIFNPLIDPQTGRFALTVDDSLKEWDPENHFLLSALTFLKKAFYFSSFDSFTDPLPNQEALDMFTADKDEYLLRVSAAVEDSKMRVYDLPYFKNAQIVERHIHDAATATENGAAGVDRSDALEEALPVDIDFANCTMIFTEPKPVHEHILKKIFYEGCEEATPLTPGRVAETGITKDAEEAGTALGECAVDEAADAALKGIRQDMNPELLAGGEDTRPIENREASSI